MDKELIVTNGCFDILHIGHVRLLNYAKSIAPKLVVLLNSDVSIKLLGKPPGRPINPEQHRKEFLLSLDAVDDVILFNEKNPSSLISQLMPGTYVKGADYSSVDFPESRLVRSYGGKVLFFDHTGHSTTNIIRLLGSL